MIAGIRIFQSSDAKQNLALYKSLGYRQGIEPNDTVWIAESFGEPIGIVRVAPEFGVLVLRGMRIAEPFRRRGLGTRMLLVVDAWLEGRDFYCVPYSHLTGFYGQIGLKEVASDAAPSFLAERVRDYRQRRGLDVTLMARK